MEAGIKTVDKAYQVSDSKNMIKRTFDVLSSTVGLIVLSPLFLIVSIWIKMDSRGPVFYRQDRVGKGNKDFKIIKFRSMHMDADKKGVLTVGEKDPRVTRSGYLIRKFKIDEFPQLINVLKGEMSIVGPRPETRKYINHYTDDQLRVLCVRPGITDWASIKYRNENDLLAKSNNPEQTYINRILQDKIRYKLEYVDNQSFFTDLKIIFLTFWVILKRRK